MEERNVFELAKRDHRRHLELIERVQAERSAAERARGTARVAADWRRHARAESNALFGSLLADGSSRPLARRAVAVHQRLNGLVSDLTPHKDDELDVELALSTYRAAYLEYMRFEEEELFPVAMLTLGPARCERLAERYLDAAPELDTRAL